MDIWEIADYIARDSLDAAERFVVAVDESIEFLRDFPASGQPISSRKRKLAGLRLWQVKGFPNHMICFRADEGRIEVFAVFQGNRLLSKVLRELAEEL
ncbi:MAG: type II toxin-antitoxin system RelE/ParE family toxin [Gemmataceae bacterium]